MFLTAFLPLILAFELVEVQADCVLPSFFGVPVGTIVAFAGKTPPSRWLWCDGSEIPRAQYSALFDVIQNSFGSDISSTNFKLPDLTAKFLLGQSLMPGSNFATGGSSIITLTENQLPSHKHGTGTITIESSGSHIHNVTDPGHDHGGFTGSAPGSTGNSGQGGKLNSAPAGTHNHNIIAGKTGITINSAGDHSHSVSGDTASVGNGASINIMPPYQTVNYIIYAGCDS
ncbi:unnamed protein product [Rotaria sp. Silwood2]|nr:unnamed protein product [Rotaria sp. Silwood2]CAF4507163.1 unnamed protein product [Rotaria sp. Silwood2]